MNSAKMLVPFLCKEIERAKIILSFILYDFAVKYLLGTFLSKDLIAE
jgi:hypothetical protein